MNEPCTSKLRVLRGHAIYLAASEVGPTWPGRLGHHVTGRPPPNRLNLKP